MGVRLHVDAWDPAYGAGFDADEANEPAGESTAKADPDIEVPRDRWRPVRPSARARAPEVVLLVDGVRRIDARVWATGDDGVTLPGIAGSFAAGVVRCDLGRGAADVATARVGRRLFSASADTPHLEAGAGLRYEACQVGRGDVRKLENAVVGQMRALEVDVSHEIRGPGDDGDDLLVVDGPLAGRGHLPRTLGYVKTHRRTYLSQELTAVVTALAPGERTPVFEIVDQWRRFSWYLRLPGPPGSPWSGVVRLECSAELPADAVTALADRSAVTLPRFASSAYKDPRAPQNLVPIAGLERRLRAMLGDGRLLHRALTLAARRASPPVPRPRGI